MLSKLKKEHLIVLSSHDQVALEYADEVIDFHTVSKNIQNKNEEHKSLDKQNSMVSHPIQQREKNEKQVEKKERNGSSRAQNKRKLKPFMEKYYRYPEREKKSIRILFIVLLLSFLCIGLVDTPRNKIASNVEYVYKLNQLNIVDYHNDLSLYEKLKEEKDILEVDLLYHLSVPDGIEEEDVLYSDVTYNLTAKTILFQKEAFRLSDHVIYGTYFTKPEQIILTLEKAKEIGEPKELIGRTIPIEFYDKFYDMEIVGIFGGFDKFEDEYMRASQVYEEQGEDGIYINGAFTKRYLSDQNFSSRGNRTYVVYYKNYTTMKENYKKLVEMGYEVRAVDSWINSSIRSLFDMMFYILFPLVIVIIFTALFLYFQMNKIEMTYRRHIFSTYNYLGYSFKEIQNCWILCSLKQILKVIFRAFFIALIIMFIGNEWNKRAVVIPFQIFSINPILLIGIIVLLCLVTLITSIFTIRRVKILGYYTVLLEERDLL